MLPYLNLKKFFEKKILNKLGQITKIQSRENINIFMATFSVKRILNQKSFLFMYRALLFLQKLSILSLP